MAITKGAKKAIRSSERKRVFNVRRKSQLTDVLKKVKKHIVAGEIKEANALMPQAYKAIDKAAKRGVIKGNTAARKKSRLMGAVKRKVEKK
jgi:small subunit ribosomal protein S20